MQPGLFDTLEGFGPEPTALISPYTLWEKATELSISQLQEDRRIEFKRRINRTELAKYYSMFSNTSPEGGVLFIGVDNHGRPVGTKEISSSERNGLESFHLNMCPNARPEIRYIECTVDGDSDFIIAVHVPYVGKLVETHRDAAFIRYGESLHEMSDEEKRDFRNSRNEIRFELEASGLRWPDDFDQDIIENFCTNYREREEIEGRSNEEVLEIRRLGVRNAGQFIPNKALALLAAKDARLIIPGCSVRIQRFEGTTEGQGETYNPVVDRFVEGNIIRLIERSSAILESIIFDFTYLGPDGKFVTTKEYPRVAWFEALVNAVAHRSYVFSGADVVVKLFEDRLSIESPGGFCPPVRADNIYEVRASRNPFLMDALYYLDYVKAAREGTRRMRQSMTEYGLPEPLFAQEAVHGLLVRVELKNNSEYRRRAGATDVVSFYGHSVWSSMTDDEKKVAEIVLRNGTINISEVQRATGRTWATAKKTCLRMTERGQLTYIHSGQRHDKKAHFVPRRPKNA